MRYVKNGEIKTIHEVRAENPNMSIPDGSDMSEYGYEFLIETPMPVRDGYYYTESLVGNTQVWVEHAQEVTVPQVLTPRQIRMVLTANNLRQTVEDMVAASTDYNLKDWWEYSLEYRRDNELLNNMATALGITSEQVDAMFIQGASL